MSIGRLYFGMDLDMMSSARQLQDTLNTEAVIPKLMTRVQPSGRLQSWIVSDDWDGRTGTGLSRRRRSDARPLA